ncbi:hypothetical protein ScPMuIL_009350 [Solemya velum]
MIKVVWNVVKKIFGVVFCILSPLKRLICRRKRHSSDTVLPLVNHYAVPIDVTHSVPSNTELEMEPWDSWGIGEKSVGTKSDQYRDKQLPRSYSQASDEDQEPQIDYFQDMQPEVKKTAKIRLKKNEIINTTAISKRLAANTDIPMSPGADLGTWEDTANAWEDSNTDLTWQAEAEIKENRRKEREMRSREQHRKIQERAAKKGLKPDVYFSAVRLS